MSTAISPPDSGVSAIILAAGMGRRMGKVKALLPLALLPGNGQCSALAGLARLYRGCGIRNILVVSGFHAEAVEEEARSLGLPAARNRHPEDGMFSSVRTGLERLTAGGNAAAAFVQPADVPLVRPLTLAAMLAAYGEEGKGDGIPPVLVPSFEGREGHPPLIPAVHFPRILAHGGRGGLRGALAALPGQTVPVADALMLEDMDTPDDHARLDRLACWRDSLRPAEALALLRLRQVPERGLRHAKAVGTVAAAFAAALTHKRRAAGHEAGCRPWLALSGGLLHDIAKGQPKHEAAGGALLDGLGLPRMARLVCDHRDISLPPHEPITERELVYLADKYCRGGEFVPLDRRFGEKMFSVGSDAAARAAIAERLERARRMEARLAGETEQSPEDMARRALLSPCPAWTEDEA